MRSGGKIGSSLSGKIAVLYAALLAIGVSSSILPFSATASSGGFLPPHADSGLDTDVDGLFNYLIVNASIEVTEAGTFIVGGSFQSISIYATNVTSLDVGLHSVPLWFYGPAINASGIDGPYAVDLVLFSYPNGTILDQNIHTTAPYSHLDFEGPAAAFSPPHSDAGLDTDDDGLYNYIILDVEVQVEEAGTYWIIGQLQEVGVSAANVTSLDVGLQTASLWFYGPAINASGIDGPYIADLRLHDYPTVFFIDSGSHITAPYSHLDFDEPEVLPSAPATIIPSVDGTYSSGEWSDATVVDLSSIPGNQVPGLLLVKNDDNSLYIAYDATGDTTEDMIDTASVAFDTDNDGIASDGREDQFVHGGLVTNNQAHLVYSAASGMWTVEDSPYDQGLPNHQGLASAWGFGPSDNSPADHRIYEFAIPLDLLGAVSGETLGFFGGSMPSPGLVDGTDGYYIYSVWPAWTAGPLPLESYGDLTLVDKAPPLLTISSPSVNDILSTDDVFVSWSASDAGSGMDTFEVSLDGGTPVILPATAASYTFTSVGDGPHTVVVTAFDLSGNSQTAAVDFTVDATPPTVTIVSPTQGAFISSNEVVVSWSAADATTGIDHLEVSLDGGTPVILPATASSHTFAGLSEASHTIEVEAFDAAGNSIAASTSITVDTIPPILSVISPLADSHFTSNSIEVVWTAGDATSGIDHFEVAIDDESPVVVPADASRHIFTDIPDGSHTLQVRVFDRAGNSFAVSVDVSVDTGIFSPTGPYGSGLLITVIVVPIIVTAVLVVFVLLRRRSAPPDKT